MPMIEPMFASATDSITPSSKRAIVSMWLGENGGWPLTLMYTAVVMLIVNLMF